ncbi:hypothetical protein JYU34_010529 [Plutella xylostella]|uniref:BESS domain-containing protein n=1 Tax=Plutella xylostella TaxID=51655 RepID=A0ABQ7QIM3_PLUXY|nr:hypothetical protein JYU34_010529 [Plutella xylostella]
MTNLDSSSEDTQSSNLQLTSDTDETRQNESPRPSSQMSNYSQPKPGRASEILEKYIQSKEHEHPVDSFFKTMASTVKKLPERMQARIKRDVFKIINDAEIEYYDEHVRERASNQLIQTSMYDVDDSEDSNFSPYIPSKQTSNISVPQYTYTPSAITPSTSQFNSSPQVKFCAVSDQTKNYISKETTQTFTPTAITPNTFKFKPSPQVEFVTISDQTKKYTSKEITDTFTPSTITPNLYTSNF